MPNQSSQPKIRRMRQGDHPNATLQKGVFPVALRAPSKTPFWSEIRRPQSVMSYESTYRPLFYSPVSF
jgi:hypothetical protein